MPFDPVLTLETAALILLAFLVGATVGSLLRLAVLQLRTAPAGAANVAVAPERPAEAALVAAPVIAPLAMPRDPVIPTEIPVPDFAESMAAPPPRLDLAPARKPGVATFGRDVGRHDREAPEVMPEARPVPQSEEPVPHIEPHFTAPADALPEENAPPVEAAGVPDRPDTTPTSADTLAVVETSATLPAIDVTAELLALAPSAAVAEVDAILVDADLSAADADEAAAMRAIEGSWTPGRRSPPIEPPPEPPAEPATAPPPPELAEVPLPADPVSQEPAPSAERLAAPVVPDVVVIVEEESEVAVADAAPLAEVPDVLPQHEEDRILPAEASDEPEPESEPEFQPTAIAAPPAAQDQPPGLGAPRYGMRDDLTQILGVLPVVETTLNRLGVYHFDQVAEWSDAHASWVEAHLGIAGRIEREHWREQARELAAIASGKRPSRKKRPS